MNEHFDPVLSRCDPQSGATPCAGSAGDPTQAENPEDGVLAVLSRCLRQLQDTVEFGAELGQIEFALFRMGLVRMLLLSLTVCGLLLSLWLVLLAASWTALMTLTGSPLLAFSVLAILIPLGVVWACLQIRAWYRLSFFPRTRRQIDATLQQWSTSP